MPYLVENDRLSVHQSSDKKWHSTETSLIYTTDRILTAIDQKKTSVVVLLDMSKAFDSVNHDILVKKLQDMSALGQISRVKHIFREDILVTIINSLVFSKSYYCSSVWSNTSASNIRKLQGVQNFAARIVSGTRKFDHVSPAMKNLRWIPVKSHLHLRRHLGL